MRSTISEARRRFQRNVLPNVNDARARQLKKALDDAEAEARTVASRHIAEHEARVKELRTEALRELTAVRDGFDELASARLPAAEFSAELRILRTRQRRAEARLAEAEKVVTQVEAIESDPVAWLDEIARKYPAARIERDWEF